ncbi:MAG: multiple monosaccharide ABC transporter ATP-binding protein [Eubacteriales bacterium]
MSDFILEMKNITKIFPGVKALDNVSFQVKKNHIHALVGENGAGKSTLMNILSGVYPHGTYEGDIIVEGEVCNFKGIADSEAKQIAIIHQELALIPSLSIAENVFLGNEQTQNGIIDWNQTKLKALEMFKKVGLHESPETKIKDIGLGKQQLVEIIKALAKDVKILILDEPTAALNESDSEHLLDLLVDLKENHDITSIIISHKLNEVTAVADEITVIRDGATVDTLIRGVDDITEARIIKGMVGRELVDRFPKRTHKVGEVTFEVKDWNAFDPLDSYKQILRNININVKSGEVVGIAGLMGAGRTEFAMSVFGKAYGQKITGTIIKDGKELSLHHISDAIDNGIVYATEDRKGAGLILIDDIKHNISLASLKSLAGKVIIDENKEVQVGAEYRDKLNIKSSSIEQKVRSLSGGNQQKVVFSKWIYADPDVLILDEPTRGIDVGAKYEIYTIINELAEKGKSIIMISSELPEILGMCDRIYVMNEGRIVGEMGAGEASQESIMHCIMESNREGTR